MTNGIDKRALFKLTTEPYLKPISDLGIGFYNLDENTAYIDFQLKNSKGPLQIHENNLIAYAYFESSNGSVSDVIEMEVKDPHKGIVSIKLDSDFLQASTDSTVLGQMYIAVNNVKGNPEYDEVAVFQEFRFEVADALINKISAKTKVESIRMFSQLKERIQSKVSEIEKALKSGSDYVAQMKSVLQKGQETLNSSVEAGKQEIQTYVTQYKQAVEQSKDTAIQTITQTKNEIEATIRDQNFVSTSQLNSKVDNLQWQKSKLTSDTGLLESYSYLDLNNPEYTLTKTSFVYVTGASNQPYGVSNSGFLFFYKNGYDEIKMEYRPSGSDKVYYKSKSSGYWSNWTEAQGESQQFDANSLNWQKYKLTEDTGRVQNLWYTDFADNGQLNALNAGFYYVSNAKNVPRDTQSNGIVIVYKADVSRIEFKPYNSAKTYVKYYQGYSWSEWLGVEATSQQSSNTDTGWVQLRLLNGVQPYNTQPPYYKLVTNNGDIMLKLKGEVKNITNYDTIIATLPSNVNWYLDRDYAFVQNTSVKSGTATIARWVISRNGDIKMERISSTDMRATDWYPLDIVIPI